MVTFITPFIAEWVDTKSNAFYYKPHSIASFIFMIPRIHVAIVIALNIALNHQVLSVE